MRKGIFALTVVLAMALMGTGLAGADSIQFQYVNSNPGNLSTLISVVNLAVQTDVACSPSDTLRLHYTYVTKSVTAAHTDACDELNFDRPTTAYDIVTFDMAGNYGGGLALFNDSTSYNAGVGAPNFDMPTLGTSEPRRGYILVNHRCLAGGDRPTGGEFLLDGEAMLFDVVNGAAWNYPAAQSYDSIDSPWIGPYGFAGLRDTNMGAWANGASADILSEYADWSDNLPIMPPSEMNTRMLVTPQVIASNVITTNDMSIVSPSGQKRTRIAFLGRSGSIGMTNRNEDAVSGGGPVHVRCIAGIDISELLGLAATTVYNEGGWVWVDLMDPTPLSGVDTSIDTYFDHAAFVTKLEFGAPAWSAGSMINSARNLRTTRVLWPPDDIY